MSFGLPVLKDL